MELGNDSVIDSNVKAHSGEVTASRINEMKIDANKAHNRAELSKESLKLSDAKEDANTIKEVVKKIIQEKMEASKLRKDVPDEKIMPEVAQKANAKAKRIIPTRIEPPQKMKVIVKQEPKEKPSMTEESQGKSSVIQELQEKPVIIQGIREKPTRVQEVAGERKAINVKESIRNIINQFKEFEKDFVHEETEANKKELDVQYNEQYKKANSKPTDDLSRKDAVSEAKDAKTIKDAKESIRDIIHQFKQIKSELTADEDDQFEQIEATYMERPIAETLMQFSEALKNLIQRRKKGKEFTENTFESKKSVPVVQIRTKATMENSQISTESPRYPKVQTYDKDEKVHNAEKEGKILQSANIEDTSNSGANKAFQDKYIITYNKNVQLNAQKSTNSALNNVANKYASSEEDQMTRKNVGSGSND